MTTGIRAESPPGTPRLLRALNERSLLEHLRRSGPNSRAQPARDAGLSKVTVSVAMANLERATLVRAVGESSPGRGRVAVLYEADATAGYVVGVDVGRAWVRCAIAALSGTIVGRRDVPNRARSADGLVGTVAGVAREVVEGAGVSWEQVVHTLIGSPGVFNPASSRLLFASNLPGWGRPGRVRALRRALGPSVDVENDANLAAVGERDAGAGAGVATFVFVTVGTGVGMGIVVDGRLYRGARGAAGEVAYLPVGADGTPGSPPASSPDLRRRGMLEEATAADAVVRTAVALGMTGARSAQAGFEAARPGGPPAPPAVELGGRGPA